LQSLISKLDYVVPRSANRFFELYLEDYNGDLIDVPVLIQNIQDSQGGFPNKDSSDKNWILTRRFFLFDTVSGLAMGDSSGVPQVIRYPLEMTLKINLDTKNQEMINVPYLMI
jgi:hypothetical protein